MFERLAERFNVSVTTVYIVGGLFFVVLAYIVIRRFGPKAANVNTTDSAGANNPTGNPSNAPWSQGAGGIDANPMPTGPNGGADDGTTNAAHLTASGLLTLPPSGSGSGSNKTFVHPSRWPAYGSTINGLAGKYHTSTQTIESFSENQYIPARASWNLIYPTDTIRVQ